MDNDVEIIKNIKKIYKKIKFAHDYNGISILTSENGNKSICNIIKSGETAMIARCGATEMRCVEEYLNKRTFSDRVRKEIYELSGVFPVTDKNLKKFCEYYINCIVQSDMLALWGVGAENIIVKEYMTNKTIYCELTSLEPYYFSNPWSKELEQKKVLVVHPFSESIKNQYKKRESLFENKNVLPEFAELYCIKAVQSIAGEKTKYDSWFEALESMKCEISKYDFDVAIIGAGAYGLPLAAYVKSIGKQAIQMSGATQILFGIKGKRWDSHPIISKFYNESWVRPLQSETPKESQKVEGGSYW